MTTHIHNQVTIHGTEEQIKEVFTFLQDETEGFGTIDFNKITPMPKWVYGSSPEVTEIGFDEIKKRGKENVSLSWASTNWGTMYNAYALFDERNGKSNVLYFDTANKGVPALMQKIAWIFTDVVVEYRFASEDLGGPTNGHYKFKEETVLEAFKYSKYSKESYENAFSIIGEVPEHYRYNPEKDNYDNMEDDEHYVSQEDVG